MNKKGFTLLEVLGVVVIIIIVLALVVPNLINLVKSKEVDVDNTTKEIIYKAANLYIKDLNKTYKKEYGNTYCIALTELQNKDLLKAPINTFDGEDISEEYSVKMKYDNGFEYEIITNKECEVIKAVNKGKLCKEEGKCGTCTTLASLKSNIPLNNPKYIDYDAEYGKIDSTGIEDFVIDLKVNSYDVKNDDTSFDSCRKEIALESGRKYVEDNKSNFKDKNGNVYCLSIPLLIENGYLFLGDSNSGSRYADYSKFSVQVKATGNGFEYDVVESCTVQQAPTICKAATSTTLGSVPTRDKNNKLLFTSGDTYYCDVKGTGDYSTYKFYVLSIEEENVNLILEKNICNDGTLVNSSKSCMVAWFNESDYSYNSTTRNNFGPVTALKYLNEGTSSWEKVPNIKMSYEDEGNDNGHGYGKIVTTDATTKITKKDLTTVTGTLENLNSRLPMLKELTDLGCEIDAYCPSYLLDYLKSSSGTSLSSIKGYWTLSSYESSGLSSYIVEYTGKLRNAISSYDNTGYGVRPVISIPKEELS